MLGQKSQLIWDLPATETFLMLKEIYGISTEEYKKRLSYLLELLGLEDKKDIPVKKLSLGERMKFELICALLHAPQILFLDEPTIGLDITSQRAIYDFLKRINHKEQTTIILTSHYMKDIENLCNRTIIILDGKIKLDLPLDELKKKFSVENSYIVDLKENC